MKKNRLPLMAVLLVVALAAGWYFWNLAHTPQPQPAQTGTMQETPPAAPVLPSAPSTEPVAEPAIQHPVEVLAESTEKDQTGEPGLPALMESDSFVTDALTRLFGRKDVLTFLQLDGFVQRVVATVDNLGRNHAPRNKWPVNPTPGRFTTDMVDQKGGQGPEAYISPTNSTRYTPLVRFLESVDTASAVKLYVAMYPLFQQAYEELGFPRKYFNDRLVEVIDLLLATPVQQGPVAVMLVEIKGEVPSLTPWVRYEFVAPELKALTAGQKMLVRTGAEHHRRLQVKLRELRAHLVPAQTGKTLSTPEGRKP